MNKRLGVVIVSFIAVSILLLGASFAKESGNDGKEELIRSGSDNLRIIYSNNVINRENKEANVSVINRSDMVKDYVISVEGVYDYSNIMYKIDGGNEIALTSNVIHVGTLSSYGNEGDYKGHKIEFVFDDDIEFNVIIKEYNGEVVYGS